MRFAGSATSRPKYDFGSDIPINTQSPSSFGGAMGMGAVVPGMYNQAAQSGWQPSDTLATSIAQRSAEKANMIKADASRAVAEEQADAYEKSAKIQGKAMKKAASAQSKGSTMGSIFGAIGSIGGALLSDETTKNNVEHIENALATLRDLKPVTFYYNEEYSSSPERLHHGFIAQDYIKVMPDATYYDESTKKLTIDTGDLIALLVRAIQQLEGRVSRMEAKNALTGATR